MAKAAGLSRSAISRIWRAFALQPHRTDTFKLSKDPLFIEKVRDIVGLVSRSTRYARWSSVSMRRVQIQALDRTAPCCRCSPAKPERRTHDYRRHGTTSLFAALDVATGHVIGQCIARHRSQEFRNSSNTIDAQGAGRTRRPSHPRQLRHPQDAAHPPLAGQALRASTCISRRPAPRGSTSWSAGSRCCRRNKSSAAHTESRLQGPAATRPDPSTVATPSWTKPCSTRLRHCPHDISSAPSEPPSEG